MGAAAYIRRVTPAGRGETNPSELPPPRATLDAQPEFGSTWETASGGSGNKDAMVRAAAIIRAEREARAREGTGLFDGGRHRKQYYARDLEAAAAAASPSDVGFRQGMGPADVKGKGKLVDYAAGPSSSGNSQVGAPSVAGATQQTEVRVQPTPMLRGGGGGNTQQAPERRLPTQPL